MAIPNYAESFLLALSLADRFCAQVSLLAVLGDALLGIWSVLAAHKASILALVVLLHLLNLQLKEENSLNWAPPPPIEYLSYRHKVGTLIPGTTPGLSSVPLSLLILTTIKYIRYSTATCVQPFSISIKCEHHVPKCERMMPKCVHLLLLQHHGREMKGGVK